MGDQPPDILGRVREGIARTLKDHAGLAGWSSDTLSEKKVHPPAFFPGDHRAVPSDTDDGKVVTFTWWAAVAANDTSKQTALDQALLAAWDAINAHPDLGLTDVDVDAACAGWDSHGDHTVAGVALWAAALRIEVII